MIELARRCGWLVAHFTAVKTDFGWRVPVAADGKGWPDLVLVRDRLIAVEIKGDGDSLRPDQEKWQAALMLAGVETYVWTPRSWLDGDVEEILTRRGGDATVEDDERFKSLGSSFLRATHGS